MPYFLGEAWGGCRPSRCPGQPGGVSIEMVAWSLHGGPKTAQSLLWAQTKWEGIQSGPW